LHIPVDGRGIEHDASATIEAGSHARARHLDVELRPLDSFGFTDCSVIKIDVEGHETSVIEGARKTIAASHPALIVEIEQRHNSRPIEHILGDLEGLGYRGFFLDEGQLLPLKRLNLERHQSKAAFAVGPGAYINNFLFLGAARTDRGDYERLAKRWMKR
jgi:hypothetical protein